MGLAKIDVKRSSTAGGIAVLVTLMAVLALRAAQIADVVIAEDGSFGLLVRRSHELLFPWLALGAFVLGFVVSALAGMLRAAK